MPTTEETVGALAHLQKRLGASPSVGQIAEYLGVSTATAHRYLKRAVKQGIIDQREGQFMTKEISRAFDALKVDKQQKE